MATSAAYWIAAVVDKIYLQQSEIFILLLLLVFLLAPLGALGGLEF